MMADAKHILKFLQRGVGMLLDMRLEFLRVELAPAPPALFRGQRSRLRGIQIPVNRASTEVKALSVAAAVKVPDFAGLGVPC